MSLLQTEGLGLTIGGATILEDVSLSVKSGEILGLIGESGSGKSMTAFSILQLLPHGTRLSGQVQLEGQPLIGARERTLQAMRGRDVGMIFQEPMTALNPLKTIGAQVAETVRVHGGHSAAEAMAIAADTLNRVGLDPARFPLSRYPHELSGGQRQRVVIAMAIALRPKLLIADEPTTALDVTTQAQVLALLQRLVDEDGMGLILITHDLAVVAGIADRIAIMQKGRVVEQGATGAFFSTLAHPYSRALVTASKHQPRRVAPPPAPEGTPPVLKVEGLVRDYRQRGGLLRRATSFRAVDGVSLEIARGENVGLVGESGCGKSTLARAILGLEAPQAGTVALDGEGLFAARGVSDRARAKMQVVFQDPYGSFNPRHTVERLVAEPFHLIADAPRGAARRARVLAALNEVGLGAEDADKYIHEFSGGQRQRIAIARALIISPALIVLDEAVSALDVSIRAQILDLLSDLSDRLGLSYLFISHDLGVVRAITDRVLVMKAGRIVESGATDAVFAAPQHPYTQQLIAATPDLDRALAARETRP